MHAVCAAAQRKLEPFVDTRGWSNEKFAQWKTQREQQKQRQDPKQSARVQAQQYK